MALKAIGRGHHLNERAEPSFALMADAFKRDLGINLIDLVNVSTRSAKRQKELYDAWIAAGKPAATPVAKPGTSEHDEENANALDINQSSDARVLPWLCKNGPTFGFFATARGEKWHWAWYGERPPLTRWVRHVANLKRWGL